MGREARARQTQADANAELERANGKRTQLDDLDWFKLQAAHGAIFRRQEHAREQLTRLKQELDAEVRSEQEKFDALLKKLGKQYKFDASKTCRWDDDTHEVIQD